MSERDIKTEKIIPPPNTSAIVSEAPEYVTTIKVGDTTVSAFGNTSSESEARAVERADKEQERINEEHEAHE